MLTLNHLKRKKYTRPYTPPASGFRRTQSTTTNKANRVSNRDFDFYIFILLVLLALLVYISTFLNRFIQPQLQQLPLRQQQPLL